MLGVSGSKPPDELKVALVGLGNVGEIHLGCYRDHPGINLVAVVEPRQERFEQLGLPADLARFNELDVMLESIQPDVVCVATPVSTHEQVVLRCAAAGAHVLCEKPISHTIEAARSMIAACEAAGVQLGYGASYRFLPAVVQAREMVRAGMLGDVRVIQEQAVGGATLGGGEPMGFIHYPEGGPGGSGMGLVDHGIHFIDIFPWLLDTSVGSAAGRGNISGEPLATEWLSMSLANGAVGQLVYNDCVYGTALPQEGIFTAGEGWDIDSGVHVAGDWSNTPGCIQVAGTEGALRIFHYAHRLFYNCSEGWREIPVEGHPPPAHFSAQMLAFLEAIAGETTAPVPGAVGLRALEVLMQAYE